MPEARKEVFLAQAKRSGPAQGLPPGQWHQCGWQLALTGQQRAAGLSEALVGEHKARVLLDMRRGSPALGCFPGASMALPSSALLPAAPQPAQEARGPAGAHVGCSRRRVLDSYPEVGGSEGSIWISGLPCLPWASQGCVRDCHAGLKDNVTLMRMPGESHDSHSDSYSLLPLAIMTFGASGGHGPTRLVVG